MKQLTEAIKTFATAYHYAMQRVLCCVCGKWIQRPMGDNYHSTATAKCEHEFDSVTVRWSENTNNQSDSIAAYYVRGPITIVFAYSESKTVIEINSQSEHSKGHREDFSYLLDPQEAIMRAKKLHNRYVML